MSAALSVHHGAFGRAALYQLNRPMITHVHREAHLVFYVGGRSARVNICDGGVELEQSVAAAVSPWEPHDFVPGDTSEPCLCLVLYINPQWFLQNAQTAKFGCHFGKREILINESISGLVASMTTLLGENQSSAYFDKIMYELSKACYDQSWLGQSSLTPQSRISCVFLDFRVRRALELMKTSYNHEVDIEWIARQSGLSRPHFFKLFKQQLGITPNLYMNTLKSEQAINDLMITRKTVTDIGFDLGFSSQASFSRFFTSNVGIPPSDYRRVAHISQS